MKKLASNLQRITLVLSLLFIGFGFTACSDDDEDGGNDKSIVGTWLNEDYGDREFITFNANGTGSYIDYYSTGDIADSENFRYTYRNNILTMYFDEDDNGEKYVETVKVTMSGNTMTWTYEDGETLLYTRQ